MRDADCVRFLQWALPRLGLRWAGFRRVRRQVCKRLQRRLDILGVTLEAYQRHLQGSPAEWRHLEALCRVTISRFYRDRGVFESLATVWLPGIAERAARERRPARIWSAGCASGEEPYTLALVWAKAVPTATRADILATDVDEALLGRAARACYPASSLRELPPEWIEEAFSEQSGLLCLQAEWKESVRLRRHDVREPLGETNFDLVLCRNLVFTYFSEPSQREVTERLLGALNPSGLLVLGAHEALPPGPRGWRRVDRTHPFYQPTGDVNRGGFRS